MTQEAHPDSHDLDDWSQYGPKDGEIANLVSQLAHRHGLRLAEIEAIITHALRERIAREKARQA